MKNMSIKIFTIITLLTIAVFSQNTNPVVSDVDFSISGTTVTVTYNLSDTQQGTVIIRMLVTTNNGATWDYNFGTATGDIGSVTTGTGKSITWTYSGSQTDFKIRIIADDNTDGGSTCPGAATIEYEGQTYNTIQIGNQCWLRENMRHFVNGSSCYSDIPENCNTWGRLYNWNATMNYSTTSSARGICPEGWHIPSLAEFQQLVDFSGGTAGGNRLKATSQGLGAGIGTNTSGFSLLLGGYRGASGNFNNSTFNGYLWSSTIIGEENAYVLRFSYNDSSIMFYTAFTTDYGLHVRCIKD